MATLQTTATRPSGDSHADGKAYFETDTNKMLVWNATAGAWIELRSDGTGSYEAGNLLTEDEQPIVTEDQNPIILE